MKPFTRLPSILIILLLIPCSSHAMSWFSWLSKPAKTAKELREELQKEHLQTVLEKALFVQAHIRYTRPAVLFKVGDTTVGLQVTEYNDEHERAENGYFRFSATDARENPLYILYLSKVALLRRAEQVCEEKETRYAVSTLFNLLEINYKTCQAGYPTIDYEKRERLHKERETLIQRFKDDCYKRSH